MPHTTGNHQPAISKTEFRTVSVHGHGTLELERSDHPLGVTWRSWRNIGAALPARIAELRRDWGNGLITEEDCRAGERAFFRELKKARNKVKAA